MDMIGETEGDLGTLPSAFEQMHAAPIDAPAPAPVGDDSGKEAGTGSSSGGGQAVKAAVEISEEEAAVFDAQAETASTGHPQPPVTEGAPAGPERRPDAQPTEDTAPIVADAPKAEEEPKEENEFKFYSKFVHNATAITSELTEAVTYFRKLVSHEYNAEKNIDLVLSSELVPRFVDILTLKGLSAAEAGADGESTRLQYQTSWFLSNIASGNHSQTQEIINGGAVEAFLQLLHKPETPLNVAGQIIWAFGNIAGDSVADRDILLKQGAVAAIVQASTIEGFYSSDRDQLRNCAWACANLCRGKPAPKINLVCDIVPVLKSMLAVNDDETVADAAYGLSYLCTGADSSISRVLSYNVVPRLAELFRWCVEQEAGTSNELVTKLGAKMKTERGMDHVLVPVLRTIGNIVSAEDADLVDKVLEHGVIKSLMTLGFTLNDKKTSIRKEACWTLSNITAGSRSQIDLAIKTGVFGAEMKSLLETTEGKAFVLQKETCYIVENLTTAGSIDQIRQVYDLNIVPSICQLLDMEKHPEITKSSAHEVVSIALKSIAAFLRMSKASSGPEKKSVVEAIEQSGKAFIYRIAHDEGNDSNSVYAQNILDSYFDEH